MLNLFVGHRVLIQLKNFQSNERYVENFPKNLPAIFTNFNNSVIQRQSFHNVFNDNLKNPKETASHYYREDKVAKMDNEPEVDQLKDSFINALNNPDSASITSLTE